MHSSTKRKTIRAGPASCIQAWYQFPRSVGTACSSGHSPVVNCLIDHTDVEVNCDILAVAAEAKQLEVVKLLVNEHGIDINEESGGESPLFRAVWMVSDGASVELGAYRIDTSSKVLETVELLFGLGADPRRCCEAGSPLEMATESRKLGNRQGFHHGWCRHVCRNRIKWRHAPWTWQQDAVVGSSLTTWWRRP
ncbi:hypothetical protein B0H67DRAFT_328037 [Lasiosphaeris hirsuta]|uniref:Ankyrin repeat protein n=1 Tax=Lasiosphaeris hirsuta TaxID=260670 RepID=A0AA40A2K4_9PEZI|nr:hypothetical protein B0H67DRAFT_328037 [Lasiosphaeris hirsuta]